MAAIRPGPALRPHVKAFKSTALARRLVDAGHRGFCCATVAEVLGMARAGLGDDLLLANETLDPAACVRWPSSTSPVTVAVDSDATLDAAVARRHHAGAHRRGGRAPPLRMRRPTTPAASPTAPGRPASRSAGSWATRATSSSCPIAQERRAGVEKAMGKLLRAHELVGGDIVSGGGTMTAELNEWVTEIQAGSYVLMDTAFATARSRSRSPSASRRP